MKGPCDVRFLTGVVIAALVSLLGLAAPVQADEATVHYSLQVNGFCCSACTHGAVEQIGKTLHAAKINVTDRTVELDIPVSAITAQAPLDLDQLKSLCTSHDYVFVGLSITATGTCSMGPDGTAMFQVPGSSLAFCLYQGRGAPSLESALGHTVKVSGAVTPAPAPGDGLILTLAAAPTVVSTP